MQAHYPREFTREQGFTEANWLACLPGAVRGRTWHCPQARQALIDLEGGRLCMVWQVLAPRQIGLVRLPRMSVAYAFDAGVPDEERLAFMKYFDLYTQRGGG